MGLGEMGQVRIPGLGNRWIVVPIPKTGNGRGVVLGNRRVSSVLNMLCLRSLIQGSSGRNVPGLLDM